MFEHLKRVAKHTVIYGVGGASAKFAAFLLIPVYTRHLTPADYGVLALTGVLSSVLHVVFGLGMYSALFKSYFETDVEGERRLVVTTGLVFLLSYSAVLSVVLIGASPIVSSLLLKSVARQYLIRLVVFTTFFDTCATIPFAVLRARERPVLYSAFALLKLLLGLGLAVYFVVVMQRGVAGILESMLITSSVTAVALLYGTVRRLSLRFSFAVLRRMISFGVPLMPSGLALWVLTLSDRYFLEHFSGLHDVGLYSLGYRFGMILNVVMVSPFIVAWSPLMLSVAKRKDCREIYSNVLTYFCMATLFVSLVVSVLAKDVIRLVATPPFYDAFKVVFLIAISYVLYGVFIIFTLGTTLTRNTKYVPLTTGGAAMVNIGLNLWFIPRYGMMGAAVATVFSYGLMTLAQYLVSQRLYEVSYQLNRVLKIVGTTIILYVLSVYVQTGHTAADVAIRVLLICLFWPVVYALRVFTQSEVNRVKAIGGHVWARSRSILLPGGRTRPRRQARSQASQEDGVQESGNQIRAHRGF